MTADDQNKEVRDAAEQAWHALALELADYADAEDYAPDHLLDAYQRLRKIFAPTRTLKKVTT